MAFEPVYEVTKLNSYRRLCVHQAVVEARLLSSGGAKIAKVLSIATDCRVTPSEVFSGEARFSGRVAFKVLFTDLEGKNHAMDYNADFSDKLQSDEIKTGQKPALCASILDTDIVSVDERELKLACVVEVAMDTVSEDSVNLLVKGGDDIYTHDDRLEYSKLSGENTSGFTVSDLSQDFSFDKILLAEARVVTVNRHVGLDSVTLEGNVICDLTCEDEDGMLHAYRRVTPFAEEISVPGAKEGDSVIATAALDHQTVGAESDGEKKGVNFEYVLTADIKTFSDSVCHPVTDAFSVTNDLVKSGESVKVVKPKYNGTFSDRVEGTVTLDIAMPPADSILSVTGGKVHIASAVASEGRITYDGVLGANIIYYAAEVNTKASVAVELPFSITADCAAASSGDIVLAKGIVTSAATKIHRSSEIQIKADVEIEVLVSGEAEKYVLTELALGEERVIPTTAFSVHIAAKGETLWEVAKSLGMTPELVLTQNPGLTLPLAGGERVIAYRHLKSNALK
jgi:hypothetical protein